MKPRLIQSESNERLDVGDPTARGECRIFAPCLDMRTRVLHRGSLYRTNSVVGTMGE